MSDAPRPTLSEEVELQLRKLEALRDKHALALFWRALREDVGLTAPPVRLVVVAVLLAVLLAPQVGAAADPATVRLRLEATTSAKVEGAAMLTARGERTLFSLVVRRLPPRTAARAFLHDGTCTRPSASLTALATLTSGPAWRASASGLVRYRGREDVALSSIVDRAHVIVLRIGRRAVACGTVPRL